VKWGTSSSRFRAIISTGEYMAEKTREQCWYDYRPYLDKDKFLKSDSWYDLAGEGEIIPEDQLPQLYRIVTKKKEAYGKDNN
jgi:hypothetical protein